MPLRAIAERTKISVSVLEALERNDISRLPGGIFGRAFVRSYAIEVGLDPEEVIEQFLAQFPHESVTAGHPRSDQIEDNEALESDRQFALAMLRLAGISLPIIAALLYFGPGGHRLVPLRAPDAVAQPAPPPMSVPVPAPATAEQRVPVAPAADPPVPAASEAAAAPVATREAAAEPAVAAPAAPIDAGRDRLAVVVTASRPCWVSATVDGKTVVSRELAPGEAATLDVGRELVLKAGDAAAVALTVNGVAAKPLGRDGQVVTVRLNPTNYQSVLSAR